MHQILIMQKFILSIILLFTAFQAANSQKFASASKGIFSDEEKVVVFSVDSTEAIYTFNKTAADGNNEPDVFYLIDADGKEVELEPEDILSIEISRGDESGWFKENMEDEEEDEDNDDENVEYVDVYENTESTSRLYYERILINNDEGEAFTGKNKEDYYLLQRVSNNPDDFIQVYVSPNFDDGGTEVSPLGLLGEGLARNREDFVEYEEYYFVKMGDEPAIRISSWNYIDYAPLIYNKSREFRKLYSIPKEMSKERTKRRKKSSRKDVGKKKKKASTLRYDEFPKHLVKFQKSYVVEEAARQKKIADRAAAREAAKKARNN